MPSDLSEEDIEKLLELVITPSHQKNTLVLGTTILTTSYVDTLMKPMEEVLQAKCKEAVESGKYQQFVMERQAASNRSNHDMGDGGEGKGDRREERRKKAASGKAGGGAQGRETKTKSTKKHYRGGNDKGGFDSDSNDEQEKASSKKGGAKQASNLELIAARDIVKVINAPLEEEGLEDLAKQIANHYYP